MRLGVGAVVAGAGGGQLEGLDGEGEVLVIGVEGEEPVVDTLLQALGLVAGGHQGTGLSSGVALLNPNEKHGFYDFFYIICEKCQGLLDIYFFLWGNIEFSVQNLKNDIY